MVFCGDIALATKDGIQLIIPDSLKGKKWIANLEGSLIQPDNLSAFLKRPIVFNNYKAVKDLTKKVNLVAFNLANNHLFDAGDLDETIHSIDSLNIKYVGAGYTLNDASKSLTLRDEETTFEILSFGWEAIQCK